MTVFKSSEQLIARVVKQLNSYQASGQLDEGDFYRWIKEVLMKLNVPSFTPVHRILEFENGKLTIPDDVYQIWAIWKYDEVSNKNTEWIQTNKIVSPVLTHECYDPCGNPCEIEKEPNTIVTKYFLPTKSIQKSYSNGQLLTLKNYNISRCDKDSPSIYNKSSLEVTMDNNNFYFNFDEGSIYLQYFKFMLDEDGLPMIPDVTQIELAIETYLVYRFFQELYYNTTLDVLQRMQYAELKYNEAYKAASIWVKLPTAKGLLNYLHIVRNKYKVFEF